jgi:hypothetical protein
MSITYLVLRKPTTEQLEIGYYEAVACVAAGHPNVGVVTAVGSVFQTIEPAYKGIIDQIAAGSINADNFHSDDLYVVIHGHYPNTDELMFDIAIGDMPQPWKTISSLLTDWADLVKLDLNLGELTHIQRNLVVVQVKGLAPVVRRSLTCTTTLGVVK